MKSGRRGGRSAPDGTSNTHEDSLAWFRISSCPSQSGMSRGKEKIVRKLKRGNETSILRVLRVGLYTFFLVAESWRASERVKKGLRKGESGCVRRAATRAKLGCLTHPGMEASPNERKEKNLKGQTKLVRGAVKLLTISG